MKSQQRLIDANALMKELEPNSILESHLVYKMAINNVTSKIKNAPTIDAVPVVRCKDCKYLLMLEGRDERRIPLCSVQLGFVPLSHNIETWYCPLGERRCDNDP